MNCGDKHPRVWGYAAPVLSCGSGARECDGMSGLGELPTGDRRVRLIGQLVERYQVTPEPDKWLQDMTLQALRALDKSGLSPADKSPARREIHAIHREVASKARAAKLGRRTAEITSGDPDMPPPASSR